MQPIEEKDNSPLQDSEISRLINVSRELGYKKQNKIPERNLGNFKPTSITQIATSSVKSNETNSGSETKQDTGIEQQEDQSEDTLNNSLSSDASLPKSDDIESSIQDSSEQTEINNPSEDSSKISSDAPKDYSQLDKVDAEEPTKNQDTETVSKEINSVETDPVEDTKTISNKTDLTEVEEAKQEGIEIGKKIAFKEIENEQQRVLETFQQVIDNVRKREVVDKTDLTASILKVVTRLASERAGILIEDNSEPFKNKIVSFVEQIDQASKRLILNLNPKDANLIGKTLVKSLNNKEFHIRENSELFRGDFILQMGSVEIGDLISEQISINEENDKKIINEAELQADADKEPKNKTSSEPVLRVQESQIPEGSNSDENDK